MPVSFARPVAQRYIQESSRFGDFGPKLSPQNQPDIYFLTFESIG